MRVPAVSAAGNRDNIQLPMTAGQTFLTGALVFITAGAISECGADPASVYGVSTGVAGKNPVDPLKCIIQKGFEGQKFWFPCSSDPAASNRNTKYGAAKDSDGIWYVDFTETTALVFYVHDIDTDTKRALVSFVEAVRQVAP